MSAERINDAKSILTAPTNTLDFDDVSKSPIGRFSIDLAEFMLLLSTVVYFRENGPNEEESLHPIRKLAAGGVPALARVDTVDQSGVTVIEDALVARIQAREENGVLILDSATVSSGRARYLGRDAGSVGQVEAGQRISTTLTAAVLAVAAVAQSLSP